VGKRVELGWLAPVEVDRTVLDRMIGRRHMIAMRLIGLESEPSASAPASPDRPHPHRPVMRAAKS
jgi:hypothetical protein